MQARVIEAIGHWKNYTVPQFSCGGVQGGVKDARALMVQSFLTVFYICKPQLTYLPVPV